MCDYMKSTIVDSTRIINEWKNQENRSNTLVLSFTDLPIQKDKGTNRVLDFCGERIYQYGKYKYVLDELMEDIMNELRSEDYFLFSFKRIDRNPRTHEMVQYEEGELTEGYWYILGTEVENVKDVI